MLTKAPSDREEEESKKARTKARKRILEKITEDIAPPANEARPTKITREQRTEAWRKDLYDAE